jgi:hypothetical protein
MATNAKNFTDAMISPLTLLTQPATPASELTSVHLSNHARPDCQQVKSQLQYILNWMKITFFTVQQVGFKQKFQISCKRILNS